MTRHTPHPDPGPTPPGRPCGAGGLGRDLRDVAAHLAHRRRGLVLVEARGVQERSIERLRVATTATMVEWSAHGLGHAARAAMGALGWTVRRHCDAGPLAPGEAGHGSSAEAVARAGAALDAPYLERADELRARLDDLTRVCLRHGWRLRADRNGEVGVETLPDEWVGYAICVGDGEATLMPASIGTIRGLAPRRLSAHERLRIMARGGDPA